MGNLQIVQTQIRRRILQNAQSDQAIDCLQTTPLFANSLAI